MDYIATFYTHFAALSFARKLKKLSIPGKMMPTPRSVSASCGSCVRFALDADFTPLLVEDTEAVYRCEDARYAQVWRHQDP
ncbi:hypothetical protein SDC9_195113 [bioreactor metagenome]|uniref:Putative Se/S carrier protein-like domain-containing protein n=1 Tax=bioreactor metagenome TaxID=1076179 RepID=A0A645I858_9ZZZZ|nr:DUF3343 domain-containing protein [Candidatus Pelethousia sp.]NCB30536.1 DUF3343 domain-containing protein [Clostridia bacterium]